MRRTPARRSAVVSGIIVTAGLLIGCTPTPIPVPDSPTSSANEPTPRASASASPTAPEGDLSPEQTFLAWVAATHEADIDVACGYLTDELVERMLAEMAAGGMPASSCAEMTTTAATLYRVTGQSGEVEVDVISETADEAELFVTYLDSGDCGTVSMVPGPGHWIITENSEEQC